MLGAERAMIDCWMFPFVVRYVYVNGEEKEGNFGGGDLVFVCVGVNWGWTFLWPHR